MRKLGDRREEAESLIRSGSSSVDLRNRVLVPKSGIKVAGCRSRLCGLARETGVRSSGSGKAKNITEFAKRVSGVRALPNSNTVVSIKVQAARGNVTDRVCGICG